MGHQMPKKAWVSPELIVLVRSKPEEAVLGSCKMLAGGSGPDNANSACMTTCGIAACTLPVAS